MAKPLHDLQAPTADARSFDTWFFSLPKDKQHKLREAGVLPYREMVQPRRVLEVQPWRRIWNSTEQEQRIAQKDADFQTHWGKLQEFDEAISELGIDRREAVRSVVSAEVFAELEQKYNRIYNGRIRSGAGYADYWWQAVKRHNPAWGQEHCPNQVLHSRAYSKCPTCGRKLESND